MDISRFYHFGLKISNKKHITKSKQIKKNPYSRKEFDDYIYDVMVHIGKGNPVTVIKIFHFIKRDPKFYNVMNMNINNLEDRRKLGKFDYTLPKIKESINRLQRKWV